MPKETFFNLPQEKRDAICKTAVAEFAAHPYKQASINHIIAQAGIAKGSFYQYFENKKDLYLYLLQIIGEAKLKYLAPALQNPEQNDFFTLLRDIYRAGIQFAIKNPQYTEIGKKLLASKDDPILADIIEANMPAAQNFFAPLLQQAINRGEVRADIDIDMFAYMIAAMHTHIVEYHIEHVSSKYDEHMMTTLDQFIEFLRHGIGVERNP
ncbi:MAG: TetR/AcrR family transcriptional regulator [Candidatus Promineifilaceae bacterium]